MHASPALTRLPVVKLCGLRTPGDVDAAADAGATAIGFVLSPSPRRIGLDAAAELAALAPPRVQTVAVADARRLDIPLPSLAGAGFAAVQLHHASPDDLAVLRDIGTRVIPAYAADEESREGAPDDLVLLDSRRPGSGRSWDWTRHAPRTGRPWILAGGLTPETVATAVRVAHPWGVDVSSGIEAFPSGPKSPALMARFVRAVAAIRTEWWGFGERPSPPAGDPAPGHSA